MALACLTAASAARAQSEPLAVDAAHCAFVTNTALGDQAVQTAGFAPDGSVVALASSAGLAVVRTTDCGLVAQVAHPIDVAGARPVVLVTDAGRVVVVASDGVWVWDPSAASVRHVLAEHTDVVAVHAGGESIIVGTSADGSTRVLRLDVRSGRVTRRRTIPTGDPRGVESLGWAPDDHSLLVLTEDGNLYGMSATRLDRPVLRHSYSTGVERRAAILAPDGELLYTLRPRFWTPIASADGRLVLLESFLTYPPAAAPRRWRTWAPGTGLPSVVEGPAAADTGGPHRAFALASSGRTLVCEDRWTGTPAASPAPVQTCWLVDL